ncbi:MAG: fibronectin type III domain-containing protein [Patescibacteria group bacterium]
MNITSSSLVSNISIIAVVAATGYGIYYVKNITQPVPIDYEKIHTEQIANDLEAPQPPQDIFVRRQAPTLVEFTWSDASDNLEVTGYDVYKNDTLVIENIPETRFISSSLSPNTSYTYTVRARDAHGNMSPPNTVTVKTLAKNATPIISVPAPRPATTLPSYIPVLPTYSPLPSASPLASLPPSNSLNLQDTTKPSIAGLSATSITGTSATIVWTTDELATSRVDYGLDSRHSSSTPFEKNRVTAHSVQITDLTRSTKYYYRVQSEDAMGNLGLSSLQSFDTTSPPDTSAPVISALTSDTITANSARISWVTDELASTQIEYGQSSDYGTIWTPSSTKVLTHSAVVSGLSADTAYHFRVKSADAAGNTGISADYSFRTLVTGASSSPPPDTSVPVITAVTTGSLTTTGVTITWTTNENSNSQVEYGTNQSYGNTSALDSTNITSHSVTLTGLQPASTYHFRVKSRDAANNLASSTDSMFVTLTPPPPPPPPVSPEDLPPVIANVGMTPGSTYIDLYITLNKGASVSVRYQPSDGSADWITTESATPNPAHDIQLAPLTPATFYTIEVTATDPQNRASEVSSNTGQTAPAPLPPENP